MTSKEHIPKVSVIMPVYNAAQYLRESIDSILRQTFTDFEFIIINDGSTDESQSIINMYAKQDKRIVALEQKNNGVVNTANRAISLAKGVYIARMDADDVSFPDRLRQEVAILDKQSETILVCSSFEIINEDGEFQYKDVVAPGDDQIKLSLYLRNPIANGSTLIRKSVLMEVGLFEEVFAEDFNMWIKLSSLGQFDSTGTVLYRWRMNTSGLTLSNNDLSISKGQEYIASLWKTREPHRITRNAVIETSNNYLDLKSGKAQEFRQVYLTDVSQLAAKLFANGRKVDGVRQLISLATSSKSGFGAAMRRIRHVIFGHYGKLRRKMITERTPFDTVE